jgi:hypothetical protein
VSWCAVIGGLRLSAACNKTVPITRHGHDDTQRYRQRYRCKQCQYRFDDLTGTVLAAHHQLFRVAVLCLHGPQPIGPADRPGIGSERRLCPSDGRTLAFESQNRFADKAYCPMLTGMPFQDEYGLTRRRSTRYVRGSHQREHRKHGKMLRQGRLLIEMFWNSR